MTWTAPRTWVAAETVTAALLNQHLRDNLLLTEATAVTTEEDLIVGAGAIALTSKAVESVGEMLVVAGGVLSGTGGNFATGTLIFYNGATCPDGWTEVTALRGRTILGLPSGGTNAGIWPETTLADLGTVTITTLIAHTHAVGTLATVSDGAHTHTQPGGSGGSTGAAGTAVINGVTTSSNGAHTHSISGASGAASVGAASVDVTMPYIQYLACVAD